MRLALASMVEIEIKDKPGSAVGDQLDDGLGKVDDGLKHPPVDSKPGRSDVKHGPKLPLGTE